MRVLEGAWEFAQPVHMCFVHLDKAYDHVPQTVLWGMIKLAPGQFAAECEVAGKMINTSKSEAMVHSQKRVFSLQVGGDSLP